jgi:hypothetical protein
MPSPLDEAASQTRAPEGIRTPVPSLEGWCLGPLGYWSERKQSYACGSPAGESNSALRVKSPLHHASMLTGSTSRSAREDSNLRAPVYQTGAWTGSATGGAGETRTHKTNRSGGFRDRVLIQPGPLQIRWGGLEPPPRGPQSRALPGELRTWGLPVGFDPTPSRLRGGCSASLSYRSVHCRGGIRTRVARLMRPLLCR